MCWPYSVILEPLESYLVERQVPQKKRACIIFASCVAAAVTTVATTVTGLFVGISIDNAMCGRHECRDLSDFKSLVSAVLPFATTAVGCIVGPVLTCVGCEVVRCCMGKKREYMQIQDVI